MTDILIIDDEKEVTDLYERWIKELDSKLVCAVCHTYEDAEAAIQSLRPKMIILDVALSADQEKAGITLISDIHARLNCPVLVISGHPENRPYMKALRAWDFLNKPVSPDTFEAIVRGTLKYVDLLNSSKPHSDSGKFVQLDPLAPEGPTWKGRRLNLPITSLKVAKHLKDNSNTIVKKADLYGLLPTGRNDTNLRGHIQVIRDAFREVDRNFDNIVTIPVVGYMWRE